MNALILPKVEASMLLRGNMKAVTDDLVNRVERNSMVRALKVHETAVAQLRSKLGLVVREKFEAIEPISIETDGITRMRTDQIDKLHEAGKINEDARAAAFKMRRVWEAMARGLYKGVSTIGNSGGGGGRGSFRHPLERMSDQDFFIWAMEYKPWASGPAAAMAFNKPIIVKTMNASEQKSCNGNNVTSRFQKSYLAVCYAVVIDNYGPHQLERLWPISRGNGAIVNALRLGLGMWQHKDFHDSDDLTKTRHAMLAEAKARLAAELPKIKS